jgi:hypothetical protein
LRRDGERTPSASALGSLFELKIILWNDAAFELRRSSGHP